MSVKVRVLDMWRPRLFVGGVVGKTSALMLFLGGGSHRHCGRKAALQQAVKCQCLQTLQGLASRGGAEASQQAEDDGAAHVGGHNLESLWCELVYAGDCILEGGHEVRQLCDEGQRFIGGRIKEESIYDGTQLSHTFGLPPRFIALHGRLWGSDVALAPDASGSTIVVIG